MDVLTDKQHARWDEGKFIHAYEHLGAHTKGGGMEFCVWAPGARKVSVVGDFNNWQQGQNPMKRPKKGEFWTGQISDAKPGQRYKYAITGPHGSTVLKSDPYAFYGEEKSHHASILFEFPSFNWSDNEWMATRTDRQQLNKPMSVYEVHLGSWRRDKNGAQLSYRQLADQLIPYVKEMGFTHIELLPVMEHPFGPSWGYQVTGFYAPTARFGRPEAFMAFIDACHRHDIGVIMDWVPGHFPKDEHGLHFFDGTPLYEHKDRRRREHADWGTHNFDYEKPGVRNFLLSNAHFWCKKYHIDGFRVDAVASMLYLDYSKSGDDWLPNKHGGNENLAAISFLQDFNGMIGVEFPGVLTIAEESTAWPGVTTYAEHTGLDFDYKWNMGWMNDTLNYFTASPGQRRHESHSITFPRTYAFNERFILPLSHDEVVHLKKSLWSKMPGSDEEKFAQLRLLYLYMIAYPGKKLLFMGSELGEVEEWSESRSLNWALLENENHQKIREFLKSLLALYQAEPVLYETDYTEQQFEWVDLSRKEQGVFSFCRSDSDRGELLVFIFNFSDQKMRDYSNEMIRSIDYSIWVDSSLRSTVSSYPKEGADLISLDPFYGVALKKK